MRSRRRWLLAIFSLTVLGSLLTAPFSAEAQKRGGTLKVSYGNGIAHMDFNTAPGYEMMWVAINAGCGFTNIPPDGTFSGDAAASPTESYTRPLPAAQLPNIQVR